MVDHKTIMAALEITDWSRCFNGEHYNGNIVWYIGRSRYEYRLEYVLTKRDAFRLNRKDHDFEWEEGMESTRYFSREDLVVDAIKFCVEHDDIGLLVEGMSSCLQPMPVLYCDCAECREELQEIGDAFEAIYDETDDPWDKEHVKLATELEQRWDFLIQRHNFSRG